VLAMMWRSFASWWSPLSDHSVSS